MIIKEFYRERADGVRLNKTYSDVSLMIMQEQTGAIYTEAIDVDDSGYTYIETDMPIVEDEITDAEAINIILGRDADEQA